VVAALAIGTVSYFLARHVFQPHNPAAVMPDPFAMPVEAAHVAIAVAGVVENNAMGMIADLDNPPQGIV
jgi:hypothetical protein